MAEEFRKNLTDPEEMPERETWVQEAASSEDDGPPERRKRGKAGSTEHKIRGRMKENRMLTRCVYMGVTLFAVILACLVVGFLLVNLKEIAGAFKKLAQILMPFVYGFAFAFLLLPIYNSVHDRVFEKLMRKENASEKKALFWGKAAGATASLLTFLIVVTGLIWMLIPQLWESVTKLVNDIPTALDSLEKWLTKVFVDNPQISETVNTVLEKIVEGLNRWFNETLLPQAESLISRVTSGVASVFIFFYNVIIGLIAAVYMLVSKERFAAQGKMVIYAGLRKKSADRVLFAARKTHQIFGGFISGKLMDSLIIGIICFVFMTIFRLPYSLLISVIVGVTNIIPFFGPFIGAVPSAIILLTANPWYALTFVIFVVILQQFDGNVLGPRILGQTTGIAGFWVMFSIVLFGGLWGFVGMVVGVPIWALFYYFFSNLIKDRLEERGLPREVLYYEEEGRVHRAATEAMKSRERAEKSRKRDAFGRKVLEKLKNCRDRAVAWFRSKKGS